jgi:hypothetical protein
VNEATLTYWDAEDGITSRSSSTTSSWSTASGRTMARRRRRARSRELRDNNGKLIGWSQDRRDDLKQRHRP